MILKMSINIYFFIKSRIWASETVGNIAAIFATASSVLTELDGKGDSWVLGLTVRGLPFGLALKS